MCSAPLGELHEGYAPHLTCSRSRRAVCSAPLGELHEGYAPHLTCSRSRRAVCSAPLAVMSFSGPMKQRREVTTASRRGSMAGLVTCGGGERGIGQFEGK